MFNYKASKQTPYHQKWPKMTQNSQNWTPYISETTARRAKKFDTSHFLPRAKLYAKFERNPWHKVDFHFDLSWNPPSVDLKTASMDPKTAILGPKTAIVDPMHIALCGLKLIEFFWILN